MRSIWLIRHGESQAQTGEDEDWLDPALSDLGREQAKRLVDRLNGAEFDRILISPLKRACQTCALSGARGAQVEIDTRVTESDWGIPDCYKKLLPLTAPDFADPDRHNALLNTVHERVADLVADLSSGTDGSILLFGHWGVFSVLHQAFVGATPTTMPVVAHMDNTAVSMLEINDDGHRVVRCWNDRSHVVDLLAQET